MKGAKKTAKRLLALCAAALVFASCPAGDETEPPEAPRPAKDDHRVVKMNNMGTPDDPSDDVRVINTLWCEGHWQDPRLAMGYQLEDSGKLFFDRYVDLYAARLTDRDCASLPDGRSSCRRTGLHLHHDERMDYKLTNWQRYIKPIQDKGMQYLMSLVPSGAGVAHGGLYSWPMEDAVPWASIYPAETEYPFGETATQRLIDQIIEDARLYNIDGIAFDDEYGNGPGAGPGRPQAYPNEGTYYTTASARNAAWERGGRNMLRFAYEVKKQVKEKLGRDFTIECYEIRYGSYMPSEMEYDGKRVRLSDVVDISYSPWYGSWTYPSGAGLAQHHMPNDQYGPISIDIGSATAASAPKPASSESGIVSNIDQHRQAGFGAIMYFSAVSRESWKKDYPQNYFGTGNDPNEYFSKISRSLFGENTLYVGDDYVFACPWDSWYKEN